MGSSSRTRGAVNAAPAAAVGLFTVAELLRRPELEGAVILAARQAAASRVVQGASVQEAPVEDFVRQDELVMTTALGIDREADFVRFVEEVGRLGASALAVARPEQAHLSIPTAALRAAERMALPLIELPWKLRFSQVTEIVLRRVLERQAGQLLASQRTLALFTTLVLEGGSVGSVATALEGQVGRRVRVVDRWGVQLHPPEAVNDGSWTETPIAAGTRRLGTLYVAAGGATGADTEVVDHATTALALLLLIDWADAQGEARAKAELMTTLLNGWTGQPKELAARAKAVGLDPDGVFVAASLRCIGPAGTPDATLGDAARWAIDRTSAARQVAVLQSWHGAEGTIVLCVRTTATLRPLIAAIFQEIETSLRTRVHGARVECGVGRPDRVQGIARSLVEARTAMRLMRTRPDAGSVVHYDGLGIGAALYEVMDGSPGALDDLRERCLGPVLEYERSKGLPLTETLEALFAENGNVSSTARRLRINRQSLLYRLDKLRKLTDLDLARPTDRLALELALNSWQVRSRMDEEARSDTLSVTSAPNSA